MRFSTFAVVGTCRLIWSVLASLVTSVFCFCAELVGADGIGSTVEKYYRGKQRGKRYGYDRIIKYACFSCLLVPKY